MEAPGRQQISSVSNVPLLGQLASGRVTGVSSITRDVSSLASALEQVALQAALLDEVDVAVILTDAEMLVRYWSRGAQQLYGYTAEEAIGRNIVDLIVPEDNRAALMQLGRAALDRRSAEGELDAHDKHGRVFPVEVRLRRTSLGDRDGDAIGIIGVSVDISVRREAERAARRHTEGQEAIAKLGRLALTGAPLEDLFGQAVSSASTVMSAAGACLVERLPETRAFVVRAAARWPEDRSGERIECDACSMCCEAVRSRAPIVVADWDQEQGLQRSSKLLARGVRSSASVLVGDPDDPFGVFAVHFTQAHAVPRDGLAFLAGLANVLGAAIQSRNAQDAIRHQALHDPLTGLPNRTLFLDRVTHALARNDRLREPLAVFFIDLDGFKLVNDTLGHAAGDELLGLVAERFAGAIRHGDTLARLGGDEFAVLCDQLPSELSATRIADQLIGSLQRPFALAGDARLLSTSIGIAISTSDSTAADLLGDADAAVYHAKTAGRGRAEMFDADMRERVLGRVRTEAALRVALSDEQQLFVHYQPLVSLRTGQIVGAEALARWQHPDWGPVSPLEFIEVAEDSGLIHELGAYVVRRTARETAAWQHHPGFSGVAINASTRQLVAPDELPALITEAIATERLARGYLAIEITESRLIEHLDTVRQALSALKDLGVNLSLDDFGTGYSSISYVRDLPLDRVKIDRSLISGIIDTPQAADLAAAIIDMAHALGLEVIAEGVETREQAALLQALGCDIAQGYYFAKPIAPEQFTALLHEQPCWLPCTGQAPGTNHHETNGGATRRAASGIWMLDENNLITYVNPAMAAIIGGESEQILSKPIGDFVDLAFLETANEDIVPDRRGANDTRDVQLRALDGRQVWVSISASPLPTAGGKCAGTIAIVNDITTRKTSEAHVIQLAALVESAGEAIITLTPSGEIATWNEAAERLYGYSRDEALGKHAPTLLASDPASRETLLAAVARGELEHVEGLDIRKGGDPVDVSVTDAPIRDANGRVVAVARVARDITERKTAQFESARLAAIVESSADAIISLDTDGVIETWNTGAQQLYGYSAAEAIGRHAPTLLARESTQSGQLAAREASDVLRDVEVTDVAKDGAAVQVSGTSSPIRDSDGRITGVSLILRDISARRRLEAERRQMELELAAEHERLLESEIRFRQIFDHAGLAIALVDAARRVVATNPGFERLFGYTQEEVVGQAAEHMTYVDDVTSDAEPSRDLIAGFGDCYTTEKRYVRKDGSVFWGRLTYSPARNEDGAVKFAIAIMEDVTAIHETQLALTKSERRLEQMFEDARTPMAVTDARGRWVRTNRALCELLGYSQQELRAISFADVTHPDDVGASLASLRELLADRLTSFQAEKRYIHRDGHVISTILTVSRIDDPATGERLFSSQMQDVTARNEALTALSNSERRLHAIVEHSVEGIIIVDDERCIESANPAACVIAAREERELLDTRVDVLGFP